MNYSKNHIIVEYSNLKKALGYSPTFIEFALGTGISRTTIRNLFGSKAYLKLQKAGNEICEDFKTGN